MLQFCPDAAIIKSEEEKAMTNETKNVALVVGWKRDGVEIPTPDGIHAEDYFRDGQYLGPDADGVEPIFRA